MNETCSLIDFYSQSPDWIKVFWVASVPGFLLGLTAIVLWYRVQMARIRADMALPAG